MHTQHSFSYLAQLCTVLPAWRDHDREKKSNGKGHGLTFSELHSTPLPLVFGFGFSGEDRRQSGEDGPGFALPPSAQFRCWDLFLPDGRAQLCPHRAQNHAAGSGRAESGGDVSEGPRGGKTQQDTLPAPEQSAAGHETLVQGVPAADWLQQLPASRRILRKGVVYG